MYYDYLRLIYGEDEAFQRFANKTGKMILATAKNDGATRLFVRSTNPFTDILNKEGWWDTFTITNTPCATGTYICKVKKVCADKDGYPIFVAEPIIPVEESLLLSEEMMYMFGLSTLFTEEYVDFSHGYNVLNMQRQVEAISDVNDEGFINYHVAAAAKCVQLFIDGKIPKEQIVAWLLEPTDEEKEQMAFEEAVRQFFRRDLSAMAAAAECPGLMEPNFFPLLAKKCLKKSENVGFSIYRTEQLVAFVKDLLSKYEMAVNTGKIEAVEGKSMWHQIEAYLEFDEKRKAEKKAQKTAQKKAKKRSAVSAT